MESEYLKQTNIIATYAGYYRDEIALKASSSGGVVSAISEIILRKGGIVYGATYSEDFYSAHYLRVEECSALTKLKGSKYVYVKKQVYLDGEWKSVYEAVCFPRRLFLFEILKMMDYILLNYYVMVLLMKMFMRSI